MAYLSPAEKRRPNKPLDPINERIRYPEVLVIGPNGENLGTMSSREANEKAIAYGLDLYCIAPNAKPPVCKILNYGKYKYDQQKQSRESKKNRTVTVLKQVQLTPQIGMHDLETKAKHARGFLMDGNKVQVCVVFRGRQLAHKEVGEEVMHRFCEILSDISVVDKSPYWEGKWYDCILAPSKKKQN